MSTKLFNASSAPQTLTGGGIVPVGESVMIKEVDEHDQSLVDAGLLIVVEDEPKNDGSPPRNRGREGSS